MHRVMAWASIASIGVVLLAISVAGQLMGGMQLGQLFGQQMPGPGQGQGQNQGPGMGQGQQPVAQPVMQPVRAPQQQPQQPVYQPGYQPGNYQQQQQQYQQPQYQYPPQQSQPPYGSGGGSGSGGSTTSSPGASSSGSYGGPPPSQPTTPPPSACNGVDAAGRVDGLCNNLQNPLFGVQQTPFFRLLPNGVYVPFDPNQQPNERTVSETVHFIDPDENGLKDERNINDFTYQYGQFTNHDMHDANNPGPNPVAANIPIPQPDREGLQGVIFFNRAATAPPDAKGVRLPLNGQVTHFLDASVVYGWSQEVGAALRLFKDGLLGFQFINTTFGVEEFPLNQTANFVFMGNPNRADPTTLFIAGDARANEQPALLAIHILLLRNHNFWARRIKAVTKGWSDEQIFQLARRLNRAEHQKISFYNLLPALVGKKLAKGLGRYPGYNPNLYPGASDVMVCASMRTGHSQVGLNLETNSFNKSLENTPRQFNQVDPGLVSDSFFIPGFVSRTGADTWLLGIVRSSSSKIDQSVTFPLRNRLFPGGVNDLIAIDNRRCRDFGLRSWVRTRQALGLPVPQNFNDLINFVLTRDDVQNLQKVYARVEDIDLFSGAVVERHAQGASMGQLNALVWLERFGRARASDRFWFERAGAMDPNNAKIDRQLRAIVRKTTLKTLLLRNTALLRESLEKNQDDLFFGPPLADDDVNGNGGGGNSGPGGSSGASTGGTSSGGVNSGSGNGGGVGGGGGGGGNSGPGNNNPPADPAAPEEPEEPELPEVEEPEEPEVPEPPEPEDEVDAELIAALNALSPAQTTA